MRLALKAMIQKSGVGLLSLALAVTVIYLPTVNADEVMDAAEEVVVVEEVETVEEVEVVEVEETLPPVSAEDDAEMDPDVLGIEEIVVTSRKREESLQAVPISVTAFTAADLEEMNINNASGIGEFTPNLVINKTASGSSAYVACMRGLCRTDTTITDDPYVGIYLDGVYTGRAIGSVFDVADIERIEVLRGPQGTLFGKNSVGGAVSVVTKKPSGVPGAKLQLLGGSYDQKNYKAILDMPAFGDVKTKIAFLHKEHDGFTKNTNVLFPGKDLGSEDKDAVLASALWDVTDDFSLDLSYDWSEVDEMQPANFSTFNSSVANNDTPPTPVHTRRSHSTSLYGGDPGGEKAHNSGKTYGYNLTGTWAPGDLGGIQNAEFKSITGYRKVENDNVNSSSGLAARNLFTRDDFSTRSTSQEVRFTGTAFEDRLEILVGGYYSQEKGDYNNLQGFGGPVPAFYFDILNYTEIDYTTWAFFTEETFWFTDQFAFSVGVRYNDEDRDADHSYGQFFAGFPIPGSDWSTSNGEDNSVPPVKTDTNFNSDTWSPRATLKYEFDDDTMIFGGWSRGYKSGGFNARAALAEMWNPYDDMRVDNWEVGVKSSFWDNRARLNATFYYEDIKDNQLQFNDDAFNIILANAGDARVYGLELEGAVRPVAGLDLSAGFGLADTRLEEAINPFNGKDERASRHFEYAPKYNWNATARYSFPPMQVGNPVVRVDYRGSSPIGFNSSEADDRDVGQGSYGVVDARLELNDVRTDSLGGSFDFALIGRNLTDKSYRIGGYTFGDWATNIYGDPRTYAVEATWRWGSQE